MNREKAPAEVLTPAFPPRLLEDVYADDEYRRLLGVVREQGA